MTFDEVLGQVTDLLRRQGRVSYRALKLRFDLDDEFLAGLKDELIAAQRLARDEDGKVLVWVGASPVPGSESQTSGAEVSSQKLETRSIPSLSQDSALRTQDFISSDPKREVGE